MPMEKHLVSLWPASSRKVVELIEVDRDSNSLLYWQSDGERSGLALAAAVAP
jgi:hypothetical protein